MAFNFKILIKRLVAMLIDVLVILLYASVLFLIVTQLLHYKGTDNVVLLNIIGFVFMFVPGYLYFTWMEYRYGCTLGKRVLKIKLSCHHNLKTVMTRNFIKLIPWQLGHMMVYNIYENDWTFDLSFVVYLVLIYGLIITNCVMIVFTTSQQSIHDKLTNHYVIQKEF